MRKMNTSTTREKVIICQTHEIRSTIVGVWNEGFKSLQSICFDSRKKSWILVFRIQSELFKPTQCKLVIEQHPNDLKARLSRLCQKGFSITTCAYGDSLFIFYLVFDELKFDEPKPENIFLSGPYNYIQHKLNKILKKKFQVKALCGDWKGNWIVYAQRIRSIGIGVNKESLTLNHQSSLSNLSREYSSYRDINFHLTRENSNQQLTNQRDSNSQLQWIKSLPSITEAQEFISDIWKSLFHQIAIITEASIESV